MTGLIIATIGWIIALIKFDVCSAGSGASFIHGGIGSAVMSLGILQPVNAFVRPHPSESGPQPFWRRTWEIVHKCSGYTAVFLAVFTIFIGTTRPSTKSAQTAFLALYVCVLVGLCSTIAYLVRDAKQAAVVRDDAEDPIL